MIQNLKISKAEVQKLESELMNDFFKNDNDHKDLSSGLDYYQVLFEQYARSHFDNKRKSKSADIQDKIISSFNIHFVEGMTYAFIKGHQLAFKIIFDEGNTTFKADAFNSQHSRSLFLFALYKYYPKGDLEEYLKGPKINYLINYGTDYFENMFSIIIEDAMIFLKKGIEVALLQLNEELQEDLNQKLVVSDLLNIPINEKFSVTPALDGRYAIGDKNFEVWDIFWNDTYGQSKSSHRMASLTVKKLPYEEIQKSIEQKMHRFLILNVFLSRSNCDVSKSFLYVDFMLNANVNDLYEGITDFERKKMFESLTLKLVNCTDLPLTNILFNM